MLFKQVACFEMDGATLGLDVNGDISYVSHAHSDHARRSKVDRIIASPQTIGIAGITYNERVCLDSVKLHPAGHMFGATQIEIAGDGGNFVYTGDMSIEDGFTYDGAEIVESDRLLIEATYGSPEYNFPKKEALADVIKREVLTKLRYGNVIFTVYPKGKSQELTKILNEYCGITPVVHKQIAEINGRYAKLGSALSYVSSDSDEASDMFRDNFVGIIPKSMFSMDLKMRLTKHYRKPAYFASLSGWNVKYNNPYYDLSLPFSDHAGYNDLIEYVEHSDPKRVYVFGPFSEQFSNVLKLKGYQAYPIK